MAGSFVYPHLRSRVGLQRTGLIALFAEISCLSLSVASIWLPGSPFDLVGYFSGVSSPEFEAVGNFSLQTMKTTPEFFPEPSSYCSIWAFITGIVLARFGTDGAWPASRKLHVFFRSLDV